MMYRRASEAEMSGTCFVGYVQATYNELMIAFGRPLVGRFDNERYVWVIKFGDDTVATVYDYQTDDARHTDAHTPYSWHVGGRGVVAGKSLACVSHVLTVLRNYRDIVTSAQLA
jgi:hypothetical protein